MKWTVLVEGDQPRQTLKSGLQLLGPCFRSFLRVFGSFERAASGIYHFP